MTTTRRAKPLLIFAALAFTGYALFAMRHMGQKSAFVTGPTVASAQDAGRLSGKPVLVLVSADWCDACTSLKRGALRDEGVAMWVRENTHPVLVDATLEANPEPAALGVASLPTLLLLRDGKEITRQVGAADAKKTLAWLAANSGALEDWKYANPGKEVPDLSGYRPRMDPAPSRRDKAK